LSSPIRKFLLFLFGVLALTAYGQDTLRVVDVAGHPLPFANVVLLPGLTALGPADENGKVVFPAGLAPNRRVRISYAGYGEVTIQVRDLAARGFAFSFDPPATVLTVPEVIGRRNEAAGELPYQTEIIGSKAIARAQGLTTADALANLSGVYVQKSQFGGGSPVVRGFEANRVLLVVDGVRMNNAIFRNGHLQNAISVDPLALDRVELIYGAGALAYGSDALGGVLHFRTRQPRFRPALPVAEKGARPQDAKTEFQGATSFSSAAKAFGQSISFAYREQNFAALTLLSTTFTSHLRAGARRPTEYRVFGLRRDYVDRVNGQDRIVFNDRQNVQIGTAYEQYNLLQKLRFRLRDRLELSANLQFSTTSDVPRYDALNERRGNNPRWARWDYAPQTRALAALRLDDRRPTRLYDLASFLLSHHFMEEDRIQRRFRDEEETHSLVDVGATNLQADFTKTLRFLTLRYGFDFRYDAVSSTAFLRNVEDGRERSSVVNTRYPSAGGSLLSGGAYAEGTRRLGPVWRLRGGLRWSRQRLNARFGRNDPIAWPQAYLDGVGNTAGAVTAALGLIRETGPHRWRTLLAQGFRAPNIDDFAKFRERNGFVQVPNPELQPERSNTLETGYRYRSADRKLRLGGTVYHTWLRKAIIRQDGRLPDGSRTFTSRGDTLFAQTNVNAESARIYGFDLEAAVPIGTNLELSSAFHYLRGRRRQLTPDGKVLELPQDHIPPPYGSTRLNWTRNRWQLQLSVRYQLAKRPEDYAVGEITGTAATGYVLDRSGTADNLELTPLASDAGFNHTGVYAWWTANVYAEYAPGEQWTFRLKGENIFDRHYRTFGSGVSAAGIDAGGSITVRF